MLSSTNSDSANSGNWLRRYQQGRLGGRVVTFEHEFETGQFTRNPRRRAHQINLTRFIGAVQRREPLVVCDNTNIEPWEFAAYAAVARAGGYRVEVLVVGEHSDPEWVAERARFNPRGVPGERVLDMARRLLDPLIQSRDALP